MGAPPQIVVVCEIREDFEVVCVRRELRLFFSPPKSTAMQATPTPTPTPELHEGDIRGSFAEGA